jgi:hypothetical protein
MEWIESYWEVKFNWQRLKIKNKSTRIIFAWWEK